MIERSITLENGIILYPDRSWASSIQEHAISKGFPNLRAFVALDLDGRESYLIVDGQNPIFENESFEACCCFIDMLWADKTMP